MTTVVSSSQYSWSEFSTKILTFGENSGFDQNFEYNYDF